MTKTIAVAALALGVTAHAQPAPPPPGPAPAPADGSAPKTEEEKRAEAKSLYEKGLNHYNLGEFDDAIAAYRKAYAISSAPGLLFNIAQAFRLKKDYENASYFYETYLRLKTDAPNRADVEARIAEMQDLIKKQKEMEKAPPTGTVSPDGNNATSTTNPTTSGTPVNININDNRGEGKEGGVSGQTLQTAGLATGGAGAALVITGVVFGSLARSAEKDLNQLNTEMGTWTQEHQDKYDAGKRNNVIAIISFVAGGAAVATGATLWVLGNMKKKNASVAVTPTPGGSTFAVGWSF